MENKVEGTLKVTAQFVFITAVIGGIVWGLNSKEAVEYSFQEGAAFWTTALAFWVSGFLSSLLLYAIGEIIGLLQTSKDISQEIIKIMTNLTEESSNKNSTNSQSLNDISQET